MSEPIFTVDLFPNLPTDFTGVIQTDSEDLKLGLATGDLDSKRYYDRELQVTGRDGPDSLIARSLICRCFNGKAYSITVRDPDANPAHNPRIDHADLRDQFGRSKWMGFTSTGEYLFSIRTLHEVAASCLDDGSQGGLALVCGTTNAAKSQFARGLACSSLMRLYPSEGTATRRPHILTLEEPIEKLFADGYLGHQADFLYDYTPRALGADVHSVGECLQNARRQTPALLYIGEVRSDTDWKEILSFVEGGHLVVATTHAGSVVDCFRKLFRANKIRSAADRAHIASLVTAVIHLRRYSISIESVPSLSGVRLATVPAIWRKTEQGVAALVSDGLSSVLPHYVSDLAGSSCSSLGRTAMGEALWKKQYPDERVAPELRKLMYTEDLNGI